MKARRVLEVLLIATSIGFIASTTFLIFTGLFFATDDKARDSFYGAFMGALFAFLFIRFSESLSKIYNRSAINHTALVRLQHHFNDCLNIIGDNVYVIDTYFDIFDNYSPNIKEPKIFGNELHQISIEKELIVSLTNIELINEVYSLHVSLRKLNDSMETTNRMIMQTTKAFIEKNIDHETYAANIEHYKPQLKQLSKFSFAAKKDILEAFAKVRILTRDKPFMSKIVNLVIPTKYTKNQLKQITIEIETLNKEGEEIAQKSGKRINAVQNDDY